MSEVTPRKPDTKDGVYFDDPELPEGWTRKCVQRSTGQSAGKWDVYVYNPMGRKFRSQNEVRRYLEQIGSELCPDLFCFNPYAQAGTPSARRRTNATGTKPKSVTKPKSAMKSINKIASKAVKAAKANSVGGAGDSSSSKLKLKFDFAKRRGRPASTGKLGRPASTGKLGRPASTGKLGRPPGKPGRPAGSSSSLASPPLRPTAPKAAPKVTPKAGSRAAPPVTPRTPVTTSTTATVAKSPVVPKKRQWAPPESPYGLVQEKYYQDPWKLLIGTIFLSKPPETSPEDVWGDPPPVLECRRARPLLERFFERWPTAKAARDAPETEIQQLIEPLQLGEHAAQLIIRFSDEYLTKKWKSPTELYGIGRYGSDAYRIFCLGQWKQVRPLDHMLSLYHNWLWTNYKALRLD